MPLLILMSVLMFSCSSEQAPTSPEPTPTVISDTPVVVDSEQDDRVLPTKEVTLWATNYNAPSFTHDPNGYAVRDMRDKSLGVKLSKKDFCSAAMEGTALIDGKTYNYAGTTQLREVRCQHGPSSYVKFRVTKHPYGVGNRNNPLVPFYSIACDQNRFKYGLEFYIPDAVGTLLPDGSKHDGYFRCDDVGGLIKGNHIDVFIGGASKNPFSFVKSSPRRTFKAYIY